MSKKLKFGLDKFLKLYIIINKCIKAAIDLTFHSKVFGSASAILRDVLTPSSEGVFFMV